MKSIRIHKFSKKSCIAAGLVLSLSVIGLAGCGSTTTTSSANTSTTQSSASAQEKKGQTAQNPALNAVREINRLQQNQQYALTSDQKAKLKPILQELINTSNPSQDVLKQKAEGIQAILTDAQKTYLNSQKPSKKNQQNENKSNQNSENGKNAQGDNGGKQGQNAPKPQEVYQRLLDSLS